VSLTDGSGKPLLLGPELGKGGEGTVFEICGDSSVAKVYNQPISAEKASKLRAMVQGCSSDLLDVAAWPKDLVYRNMQVSGVIMPRVNARDIHRLYSPAQRKADFPAVDWAFLVQAARNTASAVHQIHVHGHIIGDVNQSNFKVTERALIKLIDCDSYQIRSNGKVYLCEVGVAQFTPTELQGVSSFGGIVRTPNHDNFGLAVIIFQLLFMGRHPFAGRFLGGGDMPIEKAIREFRFAFGPNATASRMMPPPFAPKLDMASGSIASLFVRAFSAAVVNGGRPTAKEWTEALDHLRHNLKRCSEGHSYAASAPTCPWCQLENQGQFFFISIQSSTISNFDAQRIKNAIEVLRLNNHSDATLVPQVKVAPVAMPPSAYKMRLAIGTSAVATTISALAVLGGTSPIFALIFAIIWLGLVTVTRYGRVIRQLRKETKATEDKLGSRQVLFRSDQEQRKVAFERKRAEMRSALELRDRTVADCQREKTALQTHKYELQLRQFLARFVIERTRIKDIGPNRSAMLRNWNIETAADITRERLAAVPGFGEVLTNKLLTWRKSVEKRFVFNPNQAVSPTEFAAVEQKYAKQRRDLENVLIAGVEQLNKIRIYDDDQARICAGEVQNLALYLAHLKAQTRIHRWF
jgi:DNA-binding helix-hairpin-helix protein with protein kinase domain